LARVATGPEFRYLNPTPSQLEEQVRGYEQITGSRVLRQPQRNLIAACYRVHGDDFVALVREWFARTGTTNNLLGELRVLPPRTAASSATAQNSMSDVEADAPEDRAPAPELEAESCLSALESPGGQVVSPAEPTLWHVAEAERHDATYAGGAIEFERDGLLDPGPPEPAQAPSSRLPVCLYLAHEPTWVQRWDGTWRCATCHP
jgi:hypothetical protein